MYVLFEQGIFVVGLYQEVIDASKGHAKFVTIARKEDRATIRMIYEVAVDFHVVVVVEWNHAELTNVISLF
jgi:hypothetical protein